MLQQTLISLIHQQFEEPFEIIIADNNSTDGTEHLVKKYKETSAIPIVYLKEKRQGVHFARNTAAKHAKGEILFYTDDDMDACVDLLKQISATFKKYPDAGVVSGKVLPKWEKDPPAWIHRHFNAGWYSLANYGEEEFLSKTDFGVWSCHEAIFRKAFFDSGGFNPENTGGIWIGDGETGLNKKIERLGYQFAYQPLAIIYHIIPAERNTQAYLDKRMMNQGNSDSYTSFQEAQNSNLRLLMNSAKNCIKAVISYIKSGWERVTNNDRWHITRAYSCYYLARSRYDFKLVFDRRFREMTLRTNWIQLDN